MINWLPGPVPFLANAPQPFKDGKETRGSNPGNPGFNQGFWGIIKAEFLILPEVPLV